MITVIHGLNTAPSRNYFIEQRQHAASPVTLDGVGVTLASLTQALAGQGLFATEQHIFIEEFYTKRKVSKETDALVAYLVSQAATNTIVLWESKELTARQLKNFGNATIKKFDIPKVIFTFLDALKPHNNQQLLTLFHEIITTEDAEFVFFMLIRHFRILLALSDPATGVPIDEVKRLAPWQTGKLYKQVQVFGQERIQTLYEFLYAIESGLKTGQLVLPLIQEIDFLLSSL